MTTGSEGAEFVGADFGNSATAMDTQSVISAPEIGEPGYEAAAAQELLSFLEEEGQLEMTTNVGRTIIRQDSSGHLIFDERVSESIAANHRVAFETPEEEVRILSLLYTCALDGGEVPGRQMISFGVLSESIGSPMRRLTRELFAIEFVQ